MNELDLILADDLALLDYIQDVAQTRNWRGRLARVKRIRPDVTRRLQQLLGGKAYRIGIWEAHSMRWVRELNIQVSVLANGGGVDVLPYKP